ncbi:tripartite tricarboxylate transporter TctB family protein [Alphaproteobacteria bacterium]|nr:tripartite tricarboxylate transporter TctB family protein [Alphaproteobacteria bacterium]
MQNSRISPLGLVFIGFGAFILFVAIPYAVTSPSNVQKVVLAPTFWPTIIGWIIIGLGAILMAMRFLVPADWSSDDADAGADDGPPLPGGWLRLATAGALMVALVYVTPILGLVWTAMLCFVALSLLVKSSRPVVSLIVAIALPLALYVFFHHAAGVAVPQGEFIRLP